jgi:hypothetical protein
MHPQCSCFPRSLPSLSLTLFTSTPPLLPDLSPGRIVKLVRAIRQGWLKTKDQAPKEPPCYLLWADDNMADTSKTANGLSYIPAQKPKLPGHAESYNPPQEYLPTEVRPFACALAGSGLAGSGLGGSGLGTDSRVICGTACFHPCIPLCLHLLPPYLPSFPSSFSLVLSPSSLPLVFSLQEEKASYELMDPEDRPKFVPQAFDSLRHVPMYSNFIKEVRGGVGK